MDLLFRSEVLKAIRKYFYSTSVIEVVTPVIQEFASSEVFIESIEGKNYFLKAKIQSFKYAPYSAQTKLAPFIKKSFRCLNGIADLLI